MGVVEILIKAKDLTGAAFATTKAKLIALKGKVATTQAGFGTLGSKISSVMTAAIAPIMLVVAAIYTIGSAVSKLVGAFSTFEDGMANVRKTTGLTEEAITELGDGIKAMAEKIPASQTELTKIATIAGQLGIQGKEDILTFTESVAKISVAFDTEAEKVATAMAKLSNIYDIPIEKTEDLGSAINVLGNTTAARESDILAFSMSLGASGRLLGFNASESLAMGASLISMGMDASDAGTRLNSAFTMMGKKVGKVAAFLGMTEQAFKDAFGEDPMALITEVIAKLAQIEDPLERSTTASALFGRIGAKAIIGLGGNVEGLVTNLKNAEKGFREGIAVSEEFALKIDTVKARFQVLENKITNAAIAIGEKLAPGILALGTALTDTVIPAFGAFGTEIGKQTSETWPKFKTAVLDAFAKITGDTNLVTWKNIMTGLGVAIGIVINAILIGFTALIEIHSPFIAAIGGMVTCLAEFVSDIKNLSVKEAFSNLGKNIFTALGNIKDEIAGKVAPIVDAISTGLGKVKGKAATIFEEVKNTIFTKLGSIKEGIGKILAPVKTAIHSKLAGIKDGLADKLAPVTTVVFDALRAIKDGLDPVLDPVKTAIHTKLGSIKDGLEEKLAPVKTAIEEVFTSAVSVIETSFADLPTAIGTIFTTIGKAITTFGENLPDFLGTGVVDLGEQFTLLGDSFKMPAEEIKADLGEVTGHVGIVGTAVETMKGEWAKVPAAVETVAAATETMGSNAKADLDKLTIDVDGTKVSFDGLKGKVGDVVKEFGNFEKIAGELIGLDWSVFTTLKEELPKIDKGIGDMKEAFGDLKTVLSDNIDNLDTIQKDLGSIEKVISPFVDNIAPGITAVGDFGKALSDTQTALATFASMSEIDLKGMLGFEGAVHSMVMGLEILDGQIGRLMPTFNDLQSLTGNISKTFTGMVDPVQEVKIELIRMHKTAEVGTQGFVDLNQAMIHYTKSTGTSKEMLKALTGTEEDLVEWMGKHLNADTILSAQMDKSTEVLKSKTKELTKISDAIQPLISFMGTLNDLYESVFGEKAAVWDAIKVQEVFEAITDTIRLFGEELERVNFGEFINEALDNSEEFRIAMRDQGSELNILTNYIDILLDNYVQLAELMGRLAKAEKAMGDEAFEVSRAFEGISSYVEGLVTYLPTLASQLGILNDLWDEGGEAMEENMTSYHKLTGIIKAITISFSDFMDTMLEVSISQMTASALGIDLSRSFEMVAEFVGKLTDIIPSLAKELDALNISWDKNQKTVNMGIIAFENVMKPIQTVADSMLDFGDVMLISGEDISRGFENITNYIDKLAEFTPRLGSALIGLKTVWDENSGAINDGITAFSNIQGAIADVQASIGDLVTAEGDLQTAANDATSAVDEEADALAGHSLSSSLDTTAASSALLQAATAALTGVVGSLTDAVNTVAETLSGNLVSAIGDTASAMASFTAAVNTVAGTLSSNLVSATGVAVSAMGSFTDAVNTVAGTLSGNLVSAIGAAASAMASIAGDAYSWGQAVAYNYADGIYSGIGAVEEAASALADVVASYLEVHSNTELGALSDIMEWGPNVVKTFKKGIQDEMVSLSKTLNDMSLGGVSMSGTTGSSSGGGNNTKKVYITIHQNIDSKADADYAVKEIERLMKKPLMI